MSTTEVHDNTAYDQVRSKRAPIEGPIETTSHINSPGLFTIRHEEKAFLFSEETDSERWRSGKDEYQLTVANTVSSADLLYRLRCFFPEVYASNQGCGFNKGLWEAGVRHLDSGLILFFREFRCEATVHTVDDGSATQFSDEEVAMMSCHDAVELINMFFKTIDGMQLLYCHLAAEGRLSAPDEGFVAVPGPDEFFAAEDWVDLNAWYADTTKLIDMSSVKSLLPRLLYNIDSQMVDIVSG